MADPPHPTESKCDTGDHTRPEADRRTTNGIPRWVKVFGVLATVAILLVVILLVFGGGSHGPSRHSGHAAAVAPAGVTEARALTAGARG